MLFRIQCESLILRRMRLNRCRAKMYGRQPVHRTTLIDKKKNVAENREFNHFRIAIVIAETPGRVIT